MDIFQALVIVLVGVNVYTMNRLRKSEKLARKIIKVNNENIDVVDANFNKVLEKIDAVRESKTNTKNV